MVTKQAPGTDGETPGSPNIGEEKPGNQPTGEKSSEEKLIEAGEQTLLEMQDAMTAMMNASAKMMQSFLLMRMSYLNVMRAGLDDPKSTFEMMSSNLKDIAEALGKSQNSK